MTVRLPSMLVPMAAPVSELEIEGRTLHQLFDALYVRCPRLRHHLMDESGALRPHVLCLLDETNVTWIEDWDRTLENPRELVILQAVSGG
ncbi:MAG: MoaD/ThiS family protein [Sumerlaeia bacterium]